MLPGDRLIAVDRKTRVRNEGIPLDLFEVGAAPRGRYESRFGIPVEEDPGAFCFGGRFVLQLREDTVPSRLICPNHALPTNYRTRPLC